MRKKDHVQSGWQDDTAQWARAVVLSFCKCRYDSTLPFYLSNLSRLVLCFTAVRPLCFSRYRTYFSVQRVRRQRRAEVFLHRMSHQHRWFFRDVSVSEVNEAGRSALLFLQTRQRENHALAEISKQDSDERTLQESYHHHQQPNRAWRWFLQLCLQEISPG